MKMREKLAQAVHLARVREEKLFELGNKLDAAHANVRRLVGEASILKDRIDKLEEPIVIKMRLPCPECGDLHIDEGEFATKLHHTHACQSCGNVWRPAVEYTTGVRFLPGYLNLPPRIS